MRRFEIGSKGCNYLALYIVLAGYELSVEKQKDISV